MRILTAFIIALGAGAAAAQDLCEGYGPQTPRDISARGGANPVRFAPAPAPEAMSLCNIHGHEQAEHRGPGFMRLAPGGAGFLCDEEPTEAELAPLEGAFEGVEPGDAFEVHWVYSTCDVAPGPGLDACLSPACGNPQLRVEAQVFLIVNDPAAADIRDFDWPGQGRQPRALPGGEPVVFAGSTTGPSYSESVCSPLQVTWSVRPGCMKLHIGSLHAWAEGNVFGEEEAHGVRPLVTAPALLAEIE